MPENSNIASMLASSGIISGSGGFNWNTVIAGIIFGAIGTVAFMYGKKERSYQPMCLGVALMAYPYFFSNIFLLYGVGIALTAALYFWHD